MGVQTIQMLFLRPAEACIPLKKKKVNTLTLSYSLLQCSSSPQLVTASVATCPPPAFRRLIFEMRHWGRVPRDCPSPSIPCFHVSTNKNVFSVDCGSGTSHLKLPLELLELSGSSSRVLNWKPQSSLPMCDVFQITQKLKIQHALVRSALKIF